MVLLHIHRVLPCSKVRDSNAYIAPLKKPNKIIIIRMCIVSDRERRPIEYALLAFPNYVNIPNILAKRMFQNTIHKERLEYLLSLRPQ